MQCPRCGFHNIPGITVCGSCTAELNEDTSRIATYPPRASQRGARRLQAARTRARSGGQAARSGLKRAWSWFAAGQLTEAGPTQTGPSSRDPAPRPDAYPSPLREDARRGWRSAVRALARGGVPYGHPLPQSPRLVGLATLLGLVPGLGHLYCGQWRRGAALLGIAAALVVLCALYLRGAQLGGLLFLLYLCLAFSFVDAYFCARVVNRLPEPSPQRWASTALLLVSVHLLGLAAIRGAFPVVTIYHDRFQPQFPAGTRFLATRVHGPLNRGDLVVFESYWGDLVDRVVALPGDRVAVRDGKAIVNGVEAAGDLVPGSALAPRPETVVPPGSYAAYAHEPRVRAGGTNVPLPGDRLEVVPRRAIEAKIIATYGPPERREWL